MCFMEMGESSEMQPYNCHNFNLLLSNLYMFTDELQKIIDEYSKIAQEKKNSQTQFK